MTVRVVTDSSSCLPVESAREWGITVLPLHVVSSDDASSTSGLTALELAAAYGREMERSDDDGVVAVHLGQKLSSTWSAAVAASAVFEGKVRVIETDSIGMPVGEAAMAAARAAKDGGDLEECARRASMITGHSQLFLYLERTDGLRRSGRMSTMSSLMSSALPVKSLFSLHDGSFGVVARTRTQAKAFTRLVNMVVDAATVTTSADDEDDSSGDSGADAGSTVSRSSDADLEPVRICIHHSGADDRARLVGAGLKKALEADNVFLDLGKRWGIEEPPPADVVLTQTELSPALAVHTGAGAIAVSVINTRDAAES
ncbi:DegV family protein [Corynebacterium pseudokroppenstedtii]|uniref:DegV family protein n=1 Tax=Corynebacterium pseudokroppenstedtii TaxID=2804917 RepID=A0AAU0PYE8_9CORY|nr:DegV family protein [Corynebacterium pseudokroppenstedtii]QRP15564.1 DegV family protein [Corynebacterium kroppenstedtii]MBY0789717.1 DegV family protein [Corynebacterium pseudokroppenstedtii]MCF6793796.1 DegV family protein [Corynebacterium pseudokroppenstedtii]MCF8703224.1 DegV family protein [Corynebacterium pseudokroppenstedtii]MCG2636738.1 DegV family protein [Corynebacterium pseudokroppenstedtii]